MGSKTIKGKVAVGKTTYEYSEFKSSNRGGGSRGIRMWVQGQSGDKLYRKLDPNPHDAPKYNSRQDQFYLELAGLIAADHAANGAWPSSRTRYNVNCVREEYTVNEW